LEGQTSTREASSLEKTAQSTPAEVLLDRDYLTGVRLNIVSARFRVTPYRIIQVELIKWSIIKKIPFSSVRLF